MFTHNQVRQFYVANAYQSETLSNPGDIMLKSQDGDFYFLYVNPDGEIIRTDLIDKNKVMSITYNPADNQKYKSKATLITLKSDVLDSQNNNNPVAGEDYIVNIKAWNPKYQSEESPIWKYGVMHTTSATTPKDFYNGLAKSLATNFEKNLLVDLKVYVTTSTSVTQNTLTEVTPSIDLSSINSVGIVIDEKKPCVYDAFGDYVYVDGEEAMWAEVQEMPGFTEIGNGIKIVDMEKFYHGERGDIYREAAWPTNWENKMVASASNTYDTIDIHYYWNGANHAIQKSEKDITIAFLTAAKTNLVAAINGAMEGVAGWGENALVAGNDFSTVILSK